MSEDVPSPIDLRLKEDAAVWAAQAEGRPGRAEMLARIVEDVGRLGGDKPKVLELGSGPGFLAERLLGALPGMRYTALDFSPAMHDLARSRLASFLARATFIARSFKAEDWAEGLTGFDLVVTNQAVHELRHKRYATALHRQVKSVLKPGGYYLVSDHVYGKAKTLSNALYMTREEQEAALREAGFAEVTWLFSSGSLALHCATMEA